MMKRGRLRMMEEGLALQIAEFNVSFTHKDLEDVARSGRLVLRALSFYSTTPRSCTACSAPANSFV
jgi:hypothetical protein